MAGIGGPARPEDDVVGKEGLPHVKRSASVATRSRPWWAGVACFGACEQERIRVMPVT